MQDSIKYTFSDQIKPMNAYSDAAVVPGLFGLGPQLNSVGLL